MASFTDLIFLAQDSGILDFLLPFILVFVVVLAASQRIRMFDTNPRYRIVIAIVAATSFVVPHILGTYPVGYDPVEVVYTAMPSVVLLSVVVLMALIILGMFGNPADQDSIFTSIQPYLTGVCFLVVLFIFGEALNLYQYPDFMNWFTSDLLELVLVIGVFALVVYFITGNGETAEERGRRRQREQQQQQQQRNP